AIRAHYRTWLMFELAGHLFTFVCAAFAVFVIVKVRAYHINLAVLNCYVLILLSSVNTLTRFPLMLFEARLWG
ncbi:hypothetical protein PFISCL1PPCAC_12799, partial [Pristionchus fissidentatus]